LANWWRREVAGWRRLAAGWPLVLAALGLLLLALTLGYQVRPSYDFPARSRQLAPLDGAPFFAGVYGVEQAEDANSKPLYEYRWTKPRLVITLPGLARQPLSLTLQLAGGRPASVAAPVLTISVGAAGQERRLAVLQPAPELHDYPLLVPPADLGSGDLRLLVESNGFEPAGDPRQLGFILSRVLVAPQPSGSLILPPRDFALDLSLSLSLGLYLLARLGWGWRVWLAVAASFAAACALWLVYDRLWLTVFAPGLLQATVVATIATWLADLAAGCWASWRGAEAEPSNPAPRNYLLTTFFAAILFRLALELHPQTVIVDLGFHIHRLEDVLGGNLLFKIKSAEWGGRETFYLPTAYLPMIPLYWLTGSKALAINIVTVVLDSSALFFVYYLTRLAAGWRAGLAAAILYVSLPLGILPFSWGITANLFGQWALLGALAAAVAVMTTQAGGVQRAWFRSPLLRPTALFLALASLALLSHPGVVILAGGGLGLLGLVWGGYTLRWQREARLRWLLLAGGTLLAAAFVYLVYYQHFAADTIATFREIQSSRAGQPFRKLVGVLPNDPTLGFNPHYITDQSAWLREGLQGILSEAWVYNGGWLLLFPLGLLLLGSKRQDAIQQANARLVLLAAVAWVAVACLFALVGMVLNLYVRYALFLLPVVALGGGVLVGRLWAVGRAGHWLAAVLLGWTVVGGLLLWYNRITVYMHSK